MRIQCLTTFLEGVDRFEKDDIRTVDDADGARFVANGWAKDLSGQQATGEAAVRAVSLDVQSSGLAAGDNHA